MTISATGWPGGVEEAIDENEYAAPHIALSVAGETLRRRVGVRERASEIDGHQLGRLSGFTPGNACGEDDAARVGSRFPPDW
jgi:hypothetical protein